MTSWAKGMVDGMGLELAEKVFVVEQVERSGGVFPQKASLSSTQLPKLDPNLLCTTPK